MANAYLVARASLRLTSFASHLAPRPRFASSPGNYGRRNERKFTGLPKLPNNARSAEDPS